MNTQLTSIIIYLILLFQGNCYAQITIQPTCGIASCFNGGILDRVNCRCNCINGFTGIKINFC